jgi:hypothetical protein
MSRGEKIMRPIFAFMLLSAGFVVYSQAQSEASIQSIIGSVKIRKGSSVSWKDAKPQMPIREKDAVRTFVESQAEIVLGDGSVLRMDENTTMELPTLSKQGGGVQTTKVAILSGTLLSNVKKLVNTGSKFEFETPTATASIRGTKVGFEVSGEKTAIKVFEGEVMVTPRGASSGTSIKTNQMTTIIKGQKSVPVEQLTERQKKTIGNADSVQKDTAAAGKPGAGPKADSLKNIPGESGVKTDSAKQSASAKSNKADLPANGSANTFGTKADSLGRAMTASSPKLSLVLFVNSPSDNQTFATPMIPISGMTTQGAEVTVNGVQCAVSGSGAFSTKIPIPDEEATITFEIEAVFQGNTKKITRQIYYKPALTLIVAGPQNQQTFRSLTVPVSGQVSPATAELTVLDKKIPVAGNGKFSGFVIIPDQEGRVDLTFEASYQGASKSEVRSINYKSPVDTIRPLLKGAQLSTIALTASACFTVYDATADEEITFISEIDGSVNTKTGSPNSNFCINFLEGTHKYRFYAEDKARNKSNVVEYAAISFMSSRPVLKLRKPGSGREVIHIPPGTPGNSFKPVYTVELSILNVPDNDMKLIKEASVKNESTGQLAIQRDLMDYNLDFDMVLQRGENRMTIKVKDINNNEMQYSSPVIIDVR